jgi:hypothetical protein
MKMLQIHRGTWSVNNILNLTYPKIKKMNLNYWDPDFLWEFTWEKNKRN